MLCGSTQSGGTLHLGILQEWFGIHWWNSRPFALLFVAIFVMLPLVLLRRVGQYSLIQIKVDVQECETGFMLFPFIAC